MRKNVLAPSILAADFSALGEEIRETGRGGAGMIHIDVMDGSFVPNISFGMPVISSVRKCTDLPFDVHLMIERPERYVEDFARCGADSITVHAEATVHLDRVVHLVREMGLRVGVALNPATPLSVLEYVLEKVDMVLLMTVNPGFGGQKYIDHMTGKIRSLRRMALEMGKDLDIQVDGGISSRTIRTVLEAGANVLVAGSAVFSGQTSQVRANTEELIRIMEEYQTYEGI